MDRESLIDELESDPTDVKGRFREIRGALEQAESQENLTELYKRSVHIILMTHSSPLDDKLEPELRKRREMTEREFAGTVRLINGQAKKIGVEANYSEDWKSLATNDYESEGENLLEGQRTGGLLRNKRAGRHPEE